MQLPLLHVCVDIYQMLMLLGLHHVRDICVFVSFSLSEWIKTIICLDYFFIHEEGVGQKLIPVWANVIVKLGYNLHKYCHLFDDPHKLMGSFKFQIQ